MRPWLVVVIVVLVLGRVAHAQIVNVQGALAKPPDHDDVIGQVEGKLNWREGNNPLFDVGGAGSVVVRRGHLLGLVLARGEYGTSRGLTLAKKSFEHVRIRSELDDSWRWEVFAQHEYDQFRRLSLRALVGTGPAYQVFDTAQLGVLTGAAYLYEDERLDTRPGTLDAGRHRTAHRGSVYVTGHENLSTSVTIVETVYVQPRLDAARDVRVFGELAVLTKLSARIALKDGFNVAYDATPPDGVKTHDTSLDVALLVTF